MDELAEVRTLATGDADVAGAERGQRKHETLAHGDPSGILRRLSDRRRSNRRSSLVS